MVMVKVRVSVRMRLALVLVSSGLVWSCQEGIQEKLAPSKTAADIDCWCRHRFQQRSGVFEESP